MWKYCNTLSTVWCHSLPCPKPHLPLPSLNTLLSVTLRSNVSSNVSSAKGLSFKCPFSEMSVRWNVRSVKRLSVKCPFGQISISELSVGQMSFCQLSGQLLYIGALSAYVWSMTLMFGEGSTHTVWLNRLESKAFRLINSPPLTACFNSLSHRRNVVSLSIFYVYFHVDCSSELANCIAPPVPLPRCTRFSTSSYHYAVHLSNARGNQYLHSFIL